MPSGNAKLYQDSLGIWTVGYGWNIQANGLPMATAEALLDYAITNARNDLFAAFPSFRTLDEVRQDALVNLVFNMGITRFKGFKKMIAAMEIGDYQQAYLQLLQSKWATQVQKERVDDITTMIVLGKYRT